MVNEQRNFTRRQQQLGGLFIFTVSLFGLIWTWYTALYNGYFYLKLSMLAPPFLLVGLGLLLFPDYRAERIARGEDISQLSGLSLLTARWWAILIAGLLAGFGNYALIRFLDRF